MYNSMLFSTRLDSGAPLASKKLQGGRSQDRTLREIVTMEVALGSGATGSFSVKQANGSSWHDVLLVGG